MDRGEFVKTRERENCDRILQKEFRVPASWRGRKVWFTYDARRLLDAAVCEVWLNGQRLPIGLPEAAADGDVRPVGSGESGEGKLPPWFVEVGGRLRADASNLVELRVKKWPLPCNAGVWLYCQPAVERVLFLQSSDLSPQAQRMVARYAEHVRRNFAVEPLLETRSFRAAAELRQFLIQYHREKEIGGAVLIGSHELPSFRFSANDKYGGQPRFYEDLDAVFEDRLGNDGYLDYAAAPVNFGCELWVSFIRRVPDRPEALETYLAKLLDYFEGRLYFPKETVILPPEGSVRAGECGLDHYDIFFKPSHITWVGAHGGVGHMVGPHLKVSFEEALNFYPGALVVQLSGCHAGDLRRAGMTSGESYLFGRSNAQSILTNARSEGGCTPTKHLGWRDQLLAFSPHWGLSYSYLRDLRGTPYGMTYLHSGYILLGNPFVDFKKIAPAPGGALTGRVCPGRQGDSVSGFYLSAMRGGNCFGRVQTDADGRYAISCLPPGPYRVVLNLNALEKDARDIQLAAGESRTLNWELPPLWRLKGQVLDEHGRADPKGWAEMAAEPKPQQFAANDIFGLRTDSEGRFEVFGSKVNSFWLRGRSGRQHESEPLHVQIEAGQARPGAELALQAPEAREALTRWSPDELLDFEPQAVIELPPKSGVPGQIDIRRIHVCMVPNGNSTLIGRGKPPEGGHVYPRPARARAPQTLRFGFEMAEPPDQSPEDKQFYLIKVLADPVKAAGRKRLSTAHSDYVIRVAYKSLSALWSAKTVSHSGTAPFWITGKARLVGSWVIIDLNPLAELDRVDWQLVISGTKRDDDGRHASTTPQEGRLRVRAKLGENPQIEMFCAAEK